MFDVCVGPAGVRYRFCRQSNKRNDAVEILSDTSVEICNKSHEIIFSCKKYPPDEANEMLNHLLIGHRVIFSEVDNTNSGNVAVITLDNGYIMKLFPESKISDGAFWIVYHWNKKDFSSDPDAGCVVYSDDIIPVKVGMNSHSANTNLL
jgi:hypothetical protein